MYEFLVLVTIVSAILILQLLSFYIFVKHTIQNNKNISNKDEIIQKLKKEKQRLLKKIKELDLDTYDKDRLLGSFSEEKFNKDFWIQIEQICSLVNEIEAYIEGLRLKEGNYSLTEDLMLVLDELSKKIRRLI